jgi:hypothetical protein
MGSGRIMKEYKDIPIFQYGKNENNDYITEEAVNISIDSFVNAPVMIYDKNDRYNKNNSPIGFIKNVTAIFYPYVYGTIVLKDDLKLSKFKNYGIDIKESHEKDGIVYFDSFILQDVSFELEEKNN